MAIAVALQRVDKTRRNWKRTVRLTFSGNYANTGTTGDLADFSAMTNPNNLERALLARVPAANRISFKQHNLVGYTFHFEIGTTLATLIGVRIFQSDDAVDPLDELANGAYPAGVDGKFIDVEIDERN